MQYCIACAYLRDDKEKERRYNILMWSRWSKDNIIIRRERVGRGHVDQKRGEYIKYKIIILRKNDGVVTVHASG